MRPERGSGARGRAVWLDRLRGLAAVGMIIVHVTHALLRADLESTPTYRALDACFGLVAPAFLFCVGASFAITRAATLGHRLSRAAALFAVGYVMHASGLVSYLRSRDAEGLSLFFQADILQVIAIALVSLALLSWAMPLRWPIAAAVIATLAVIVAPALEALPASALPAFAMPYVSHAVPTQFPIAPWITYALFSAALLHAVKDRAPLQRRNSLLVAALLASAACLDGSCLTARDPSHVLATFVVMMATAFVLARIRLENKIDRALALFGRRSLFLYVVHIPVVYGRNPWSLRAIIGPRLDAFACAAASLAVVAAMGALAWGWDAFWTSRKKTVTPSRASRPS